MDFSDTRADRELDELNQSGADGWEYAEVIRANHEKANFSPGVLNRPKK
jgi:hypothetical protein